MTVADVANGTFELLGAVLVWLNVGRIRRDRCVRGVDWRAWIVFTSWGWWNLYYYPSLGQWFSAAGGAVMVAANTVWVAYAIKYRGN